MCPGEGYERMVWEVGGGGVVNCGGGMGGVGKVGKVVGMGWWDWRVVGG